MTAAPTERREREVAGREGEKWLGEGEERMMGKDFFALELFPL